MTSYVPPVRGVAFDGLYVTLTSQADTKLDKTTPTIAAGDFTVSKDGGAFANWAAQPFTAAELAAALNGLALVVETTDGVNLTNIHTACKAIDRIVRAML